jgi:tetratricopeptide (TPR) repeat protein
VSLASQPNATAHPGSAVQVFSFIGDTGSDTSEVVYYVDDIVLSADRPVDLAPFVAPGRRKLFVDAWVDQKRMLASGPVCFPVADVALDLGLDPSYLQGSAPSIARKVLEGALDPRGPHPPVKALGELPAPLAAVVLWAHGCEELRAKRADDARAAFGRAEALWPRGRIYPLSRALALARAKQTDEADRVLASLAGRYRDDLRPELAMALVGIARDDLDAALRILAPPADGLPAELTGDALRLAEQYFFVLLWRGSFTDALRYATAVEAKAREAALPTTVWTEHVGDAAFLLGDPSAALGAYQSALMSRDGKDARLYEKLADAYFRLGDLEQERAWREKVYGSLH